MTSCCIIELCSRHLCFYVLRVLNPVEQRNIIKNNSLTVTVGSIITIPPVMTFERAPYCEMSINEHI